MPSSSRQLAAILFTDIIGYTAMMQQDEKKAVTLARRYQSVMKEAVSQHGGEILNDYGDGNLCSFSSATAAVQCAVALQKKLQQEPAVPLRIGLHIGEIFFEDGKTFGDGVNIASRIQSLGIANSILFSGEINSKLKNQSEFTSVSLGRFHFKNIEEPLEVFALANEGLIVPDKKKITGKLEEKKSGNKKWVIAGIALAAILIGGFFTYRVFSGHPGFTGSHKTIAVLPFENIGIIDSEAYISDGITQDIINNLSKISALQKVIGWLSVRGLKKTTKTVKEIAGELNVAAILSGTIQKESGKTRIIAELIDVETNERIWGDDFEYESKDLVSIQSNVATQIVAALKANLTPAEKVNLTRHYTENVDAYKFYMRGRTFWYARGKNNFDSAEAYFKKAIALDPSYALAYAGIADCYLFNYKGMPQLEAIPIARSYANRALSLDSNLSEGLTSLGFIQHNFDYEWKESRKTLEKAIALNPNNATAHLYLGNLLQYTGDTQPGLDEVRKAVELEPLAFGPNWVLGRNYYLAGKIEESLAQLKRTQALAPKSDEVYISLAQVYLTKKMNKEALEQFKLIPSQAVNLIDNIPIMTAYAYAIAGDKEKAKEFIAKGLQQPNPSPYRLAEVYVTLGENTQALDNIEKGYDIRDLHMMWLKIDPAFVSIRQDPRFKAVLSKMNLE